MVRRLGEVFLFDLLSSLHIFFAVIMTGAFCVAALPFATSGGVFGMTFGMALLDFLLTLVGVVLGAAFGVWQFLWARRLAHGIVAFGPGLLLGLALLLGVAPISIVEQQLLISAGEEAPILGVIPAASRLLGLLTIIAIALHALARQRRTSATDRGTGDTAP